MPRGLRYPLPKALTLRLVLHNLPLPIAGGRSRLAESCPTLSDSDYLDLRAAQLRQQYGLRLLHAALGNLVIELEPPRPRAGGQGRDTPLVYGGRGMEARHRLGGRADSERQLELCDDARQETTQLTTSCNVL